MPQSASLKLCIIAAVFLFTGTQPSRLFAQVNSAAKAALDVRPCDQKNLPHVSAQEAFADARQVRTTGRTDEDADRMACWLMVAHKQRFATAAVQLGLLFYDADDVPHHLETAAALFEEAGKKGDLIAR